MRAESEQAAPTGSADILRLQRAVGNAAVTNALLTMAQREADGAGASASGAMGVADIGKMLTHDLFSGQGVGARRVDLDSPHVRLASPAALQRQANGAVVGAPITSTAGAAPAAAGAPGASGLTEQVGTHGSSGSFTFNPVEAHLKYPGKTEVQALKFNDKDVDLPFGQELQPEQDPAFNARGSGRGAVEWTIKMSWDFGRRLSEAAGEGLAGSTSLGGAPFVSGMKKAVGEAFVSVVVPFNVQHAAFDKPLSGSDRQRTQAEQQSQTPGGPMRADRNKITIQWGQPRTTEMSSDGKGANLTGAPVVTDTSDDGGSVTISPQLQIQSQLAAAAQGTTAASPLGLPTASGQYQEQMSDTQALTRSFTANVKVPPPQTLAPKMQFEGASATVGPFSVDSDKLAGDAEENMSEWYLGERAFTGPDGVEAVAISQAARDLIESGQVELRITGHASATGSFAHNRDLSR
ncbi:MAG TPA: hypothetical protein VF937_08635, partial [Chloroflexota bacterium]